jgi:hypothetical protein
MNNTDTDVPNLYSVTPSGEKLSINALPVNENESTSIPLGLKTNKDGFVAFRVKDAKGVFGSMRLYLTDMITGSIQDIQPGNEYRIYLVSGEYTGRFYLNAYTNTTDIPESKPIMSDIFSIYSSAGVLKAEINHLINNKGSLFITNLLGQTLYSSEIIETGYHEFTPGIKDGIYIATFISGNTKVSRKLFIKN